MATLTLARYLKKKGISKRQFAKKLKVEYYSVFRYFREGYDPKLSVLTRWAKALSCRVRDLIEE